MAQLATLFGLKLQLSPSAGFCPRNRRYKKRETTQRQSIGVCITIQDNSWKHREKISTLSTTELHCMETRWRASRREWGTRFNNGPKGEKMAYCNISNHQLKAFKCNIYSMSLPSVKDSRHNISSQAWTMI